MTTRRGSTAPSRAERRRQNRSDRREQRLGLTASKVATTGDGQQTVNHITRVIAILSRPAASTAGGAILLLAFALFLSLQLRMVFAYYDDWGMAALDFHQITVEGARGRESALPQVIDYLHQFYMRWSGRVFAFFIQIYAFKIAGADGARVVQFAATLAMIVLCGRLASPSRALGWAVAVPAILYLAVPLHVAARGVYWFSASSHSLWSVPLLLAAALMCLRHGSITRTCSVLFGVAALFNEMVAAATLVVIGTHLIATTLSSSPRRLPLGQLLLGAPAAIAACVVVLAPGNFARLRTFEAPTVDRLGGLIRNMGQVESLLLESSASTALLLLWLMSAIALICLIGVSRGWFRAALYGTICAAAVATGTMMSSPVLLGVALLAYPVLLLALRRMPGCVMMLGIYGGAVATLVPLMVSPEIFPRSLMTFCFLLFPPIAWSIVRLSAVGPAWTVASTLAVFLSVIPAVTNARAIYRGYATSYAIHTANEQALERVSLEVSQGLHDGSPVPYYTLPNVRFAELMPYQREFIEVWIKKYYSIPLEVKFEYLPPERLGSTGSSAR